MCVLFLSCFKMYRCVFARVYTRLYISMHDINYTSSVYIIISVLLYLCVYLFIDCTVCLTNPYALLCPFKMLI